MTGAVARTKCLRPHKGHCDTLVVDLVCLRIVLAARELVYIKKKLPPRMRQAARFQAPYSTISSTHANQLIYGRLR